MRTLTLMTVLVVLILPAGVFAETQTYTATHTYILGDHESKDDARQRCLLEAKRKILEQAGVYIESASEVNNLDLTKDKITSFAAAVMQVKDTKEDVGFQQGHMTLTLKLTAQVDIEEVRNQLAARQVDTGVRDDVAIQKERLKRLETLFEAMQLQMQQAPGRTPIPPTLDILTVDVQWLRTQAAQGNAKAQLNLGVLYYQGHGVPQDYVMARQWWEKAAAQGNAAAQVDLGMLYGMGQGVPQDRAQAAKWFQKAAAQGDAVAQAFLGQYYSGGLGVSQDYVQARQWYEKAAARGDAEAQIELGMLYAKGQQGVPQDFAQARRWWEKAAAQGNSEALSNLAVLHYSGRGVPQDYVQARHWWEKAAAQGGKTADHAQWNLGRLYAEGKGVPQNYTQAAKWYEKAAAQGNAVAQFDLGKLYAKGQGVPQDYRIAQQWWEKAAAQGFDDEAMSSLVELYANGQGVPQDNGQVRSWWKTAALFWEPLALMGDVKAQRNLDVLYANGLARPQ